MDDYLWLDDGIRWVEQRRELNGVIADALREDEIAAELKSLGIPAIEVARAIRDTPDMVARYRRRRWPLEPTSADEPRFGRLSGKRWLTRLRPGFGSLLGLGIVIGYVVLLVKSLPLMPLWLRLFAFVGLVAALGAAVLLSMTDAILIFRMIQQARNADYWEDDVRENIVLPEIRQYLAAERKPIHGTELSVARAHLDDGEAPTVVTSAGHQLRRIISRPAAGAIAISGPRGVGKTTTIRAIADGTFSDPYSSPPLPVVVSAPSRYDGRDFLLHLYSELCQQVINLTSAILLLPETPSRRSPKRLVAVVALVAVLCGTASVLWTGVFVTRLRESGFLPGTGVREQVALALVDVALAVGALAVVFSLPRAGWRAIRRAIRGNRYPRLKALRADAVDQLRRIRFLHSYTSGWSGKIGLASAEAGWNASVQRAEQNRTTPEIVESFRNFAERVSFRLSGIVDRLVIAVDELDKIDDPGQAQEMVNDIKGIFGIPNCLFLVSVSEDAMSAFERRGIPVRDAFDSAFTRMVRMDHFTLAESRRWLSRRLLGVPEQFIYQLHCLSGGLPRELHRVTTELVDIVAEDERGDLEHVTRVLLDRELDRKTHAFAAAARRSPDTVERSDYLAALVTAPSARTPEEQAALALRLAPGEEVTELRGVRWQSACFLLFCATVRQIFDNTLDAAGLDERLESLALARAQLSIDPQVAWRLIQSVRL